MCISSFPTPTATARNVSTQCCTLRGGEFSPRDGANGSYENMAWWRRRESNPKASREDTSTDCDSSETRHTQVDHNSKRCGSPANTTPRITETLPEHSQSTSETAACAPGVPGSGAVVLVRLPADIPSNILDALQAWGHLPPQIRHALAAILETVGPGFLGREGDPE